MTGSGIAGLILSGGASRRMGTPKALLQISGETFLDSLIRKFALHCDSVMVVLGYEPERVRQGLKAAAAAAFTVNPIPERGMFSSLQSGLAELPESASAVIFTPVDYPQIHSDTVALLTAAFQQCDCDVIIPVNEGAKGHPVCISRRLIDEMLALSPSAQAREVIRRHRERTVFIDVDDPGIALDVDTPADYEKLTEALACHR